MLLIFEYIGAPKPAGRSSLAASYEVNSACGQKPYAKETQVQRAVWTSFLKGVRKYFLIFSVDSRIGSML